MKMILIIITEKENLKDEIGMGNFRFFNKTFILKPERQFFENNDNLSEEKCLKLIQILHDEYFFKYKDEIKIYIDPQIPEPIKSFIYNQFYYTTFIFSIYENNKFKKWITY